MPIRRVEQRLGEAFRLRRRTHHAFRIARRRAGAGEVTMKLRSIGAAIAALTLLATPYSADAADMPVPIYKGGVRSVIAYYNWTGFYAGINARLRLGQIGLERAQRRHQPVGIHHRRHARLQLPDRFVRLGP